MSRYRSTSLCGLDLFELEFQRARGTDPEAGKSALVAADDVEQFIEHVIGVIIPSRGQAVLGLCEPCGALGVAVRRRRERERVQDTGAAPRGRRPLS